MNVERAIGLMSNWHERSFFLVMAYLNTSYHSQKHYLGSTGPATHRSTTMGESCHHSRKPYNWSKHSQSWEYHHGQIEYDTLKWTIRGQ